MPAPPVLAAISPSWREESVHPVPFSLLSALRYTHPTSHGTPGRARENAYSILALEAP